MSGRIPTLLHTEMVRQGRMSKWLADEIGVHETQVSRWRHGIHVPSEGTQEKIALALGRNLSDLWPGAGAESMDEAA